MPLRMNLTNIILLVYFTLAACTVAVKSTPISAVNSTEVPEGIIYHLPITSLLIEASYRLDSCFDGVTGKTEVTIINAKITSETVPDVRPEMTFLIDPGAMTNGLKLVPEAKIELNEGYLKTVTFDADDKTRDIIGSIADVALRFGAQTVPGGLSLKRARIDRRGVKCNRPTVNVFKDKMSLETSLRKNNKELSVLKKTYEATGKKSDLRKVDAKQSEIQQTIGKLKELVSTALTFRYVHRVVPTYAPIDPKLLTPPPYRLFQHSVPPPEELIHKWFEKGNFPIAKIKTMLKGNLAFRVTIDSENRPNNSRTTNLSEFKGIYYRSPGYVDVSIFKGDGSNIRQDDLLAKTSGRFFQFGNDAKLKVTNRVFQSNKYVIKFDDSGSLVSYQYEEKKVRIAEGVGAVDDVLQKVESSEKSRIDAETALLNAESARLDAEKKLREAEDN